MTVADDPFEALNEAYRQEQERRRQEEEGSSNGHDGNPPLEFATPKELVDMVLEARDYRGPLGELAERLLKVGLNEARAVNALEGIMLLVDPGQRDFEDGVRLKDRWFGPYSHIRKIVSAARVKIDARPQDHSWPEPAPLLSDEIEKAPPFPIDFLPGRLADFVSDVTHRMQCPMDIVGIPLIIAAATAIGKGFRLAPKAKDDWTERACLWGGLILPIGSMKSPGFAKALRPLRELQSDFHRLHEREVAEYEEKLELAEYAETAWKADCRKAQKDGLSMPEKPEAAQLPQVPKLTRLLVGDVTQEALVDLINESPRGLLQFRDEMSAWFDSFNQYRPGADRQFYLECHAGGPFIKDRRLESISIDHLYLNICGGIQPDIVRKALAGGDLDGMTARFSLLVWPDPHKTFEYVEDPPNAAAQNTTTEVIKDLYRLDPKGFFGSRAPYKVREFRFDDPAQRIFTTWYTKHEIAVRNDEDAVGLKAQFRKYSGLFARLAIVHHLIRYTLKDTTSAVEVDKKTALAVQAFIDHYLKPQAHRIHNHLGGNPIRDNARRIAAWIAKETGITEFTSRDIRQKDWSGLTEQDKVNQALDYLENNASWIRCSTNLPGPKGGRPSSTYRINPRIRQNGGGF
jgi:hypothetical protein